MQIGLAGCGQMGRPMAEAIQAAGFNLRGLDVRPAAEFDSFAQSLAASPREFSSDIDILISVVRDIPQTDALLFDDQAVLSLAPRLSTVVISSTLSPRYIRELRDRIPSQIALIDAPMSGAPVAAQERRLSFMLGGEQNQIDPLMPLFRAMGQKIHHLGPLGTGMTAKVLNNLVAASSTAATRLALQWGDTLGIDDRDLLAVLNDSSGQTWFGTNFDRISWSRQGFVSDNTMGILKKDVESLLDAVPADECRDLPNAIISAICLLQEID